MSLKITVGITGDKKEVKKLFKKLVRKSPKATQQAAKKTAKLYLKSLQSNIKGSNGVQGIAPSTRRTRQVGKIAGKFPAVPRYSSSRPLIRSGSLLRSIEMRKVGKSYIVGIQPGAKGPQGQDLTLVARGLEDGIASISIRLTMRMKRYLDVIYGNKSSSGGGQRGIGGSHSGLRRVKTNQRSSAADFVISTFVVKIPARPVWRMTFTASLKPAIEMFVNTYLKKVGLI